MARRSGSAGEIVLPCDVPLHGEVVIRATTRLAVQKGDAVAKRTQLQTASMEDARELLRTLFRAGVPAQVIRRAPDGMLTICVVTTPLSSRDGARLVVEGDLTLDRQAVCVIDLQVEGNLRLEPDAILVGSAIVSGSIVLGARSVVTRALEARGHASLAPFACAGSLRSAGELDLAEGASVISGLEIDLEPDPESNAPHRPADERPPTTAPDREG